LHIKFPPASVWGGKTKIKSKKMTATPTSRPFETKIKPQTKNQGGWEIDATLTTANSSSSGPEPIPPKNLRECKGGELFSLTEMKGTRSLLKNSGGGRGKKELVEEKKGLWRCVKLGKTKAGWVKRTNMWIKK